MVVQWLRLCTPNAGDTGSIPGWGTKVPYVVGCKKKLQSISSLGNRYMGAYILTLFQCAFEHCHSGKKKFKEEKKISPT